MALLYPIEGHNNGHWVLLWYNYRNGRDLALNFFCPYGTNVDGAFVNGASRMLMPPHLSEMLLESDYPVYYNEHQLQSWDPQITTCGRWILLRAEYSRMNEHQFARTFGHNGRAILASGDPEMTPDELVVEMIRL